MIPPAALRGNKSYKNIAPISHKKIAQRYYALHKKSLLKSPYPEGRRALGFESVV